MTFGPLAFAAPGLLLALIALPILWLLLRAIPPAPIRRRFPAVALMLGLTDEDRQADKTPWWLLLLRALAIAAAIIGFAGPVLNPDPRDPGTGPLLILLDGGWADARDWPRTQARAQAALEEAARMGRPVAVARLTDAAQPITFSNPADWAGRLAAMQPAPYAPAYAGWEMALPEGGFETLWLADGLDHKGRADLAAALAARGRLTAALSPRPAYGLRPATLAEGKITLTTLRLGVPESAELDVTAHGPDPAGIDRELGRARMVFAPGADQAQAVLEVPPELRNRINRFSLLGQRTAGAVALTDDSLKRRKIAVIDSGADREGLQLLAPGHYLRQALVPVADLLDGTLTDILPAKPDVIILADVAKLTQAEQDGVLDWLDSGGLLLRFAGPRLAASDVARSEEDPLLPVRLREGGRSVGGTMSWGEPKPLAPFAEGSPFHGLVIPSDVTVTEQVLAQPDPDLASRTIAALADGTPLVTRKPVGAGQVVLVHVTANAEWSSLPLSGLFMQMLERLAVSARVGGGLEGAVEGLIWSPERMVDGYGDLVEPGDLAGVEGEALALALQDGPSAKSPPGLYRHEERLVALNTLPPSASFRPAIWPAGTLVEGLGAARSQALGGWLLAAALALLALDILASVVVSGRMPRLGRAALVVLALALPTPEAQAQTPDPAADARGIEATRGVVLAHVLTGNAEIDDTAAAGLRGLGDQLWLRTSVEPEPPMGVDLEEDELAFFPFLYWPITPDQPVPSTRAYAKLNAFLRTGGMILFDTRDADIAGMGGATAEGEMLQLLASGLDVPPLDLIPEDHVLTRSFYLLQDFPGRHRSADLWVEAPPPDAGELEEGMAFRNLNDGVTPVIIGGNDWASAWAIDGTGAPLYPVGRGLAGEDQREMAYRFGINVVMHVLTGNYKSDQVHVPALLERLGQ
ncbi:DUF4159 domain-containing protein [Tabrizicola oligotrophica]|uniref:DUF4159 domain-containing protein n=1 Tax=Tabrizicola oligotrophica TaxID=2710650 RepID=A0A6M0QQM2_9RHOB|nr:DUF4159 domain-containing protein [Tabrizicola oligotrophica]NEY89790.1 DUF4159 domain-containing protein [Tabrizicola oligotrophica]